MLGSFVERDAGTPDYWREGAVTRS
jgi:hypothetical protein